MGLSCGDCDGVAIYEIQTDPVPGFSLFKLVQILSCDLKRECREVLWSFLGAFFMELLSWTKTVGLGKS